MGIAGTALQRVQIDVGIEGFVRVGVAGADFQIDHELVRTILQMVSVRHPSLEARAITGAQYFLAGIGDEDDFAGEYVDELVLDRMPVPLAGPATRGQLREVGPELRQPRSVTEAATEASLAGNVEGRGVP